MERVIRPLPRQGSVTMLGLGILVALGGDRAAAQPRTNTLAGEVGRGGPIISEPSIPVRLDVDLRELPSIPRTVRSGESEEIWRYQQHLTGSSGADPVVQNWMGGTGILSAPIANFRGLDSRTWGRGDPPDTNGDVGPNHYLQTVNSSFGVFDKITGQLLSATTYASFFSDLPPCNGDYSLTDPVALYDPLADRWLVAIEAYRRDYRDSYVCFGVSQTNDPVSGGWYRYAFHAHDSNQYDAPKIGVWPDAYYMTGLVCCGSPPHRFWALNRAAMLSGDVLIGVAFDRDVMTFAGQTPSLPSNFRGTPPAPGTPNFIVRASFVPPQMLHIWKFSVNFDNPSLSSLIGPTDLPVAPYSFQTDEIPQQGTSYRLSALGAWPMPQLQYRVIGGVESLWCNQSVASGGVVGIRWYEVRDPSGSPHIAQQGTYQPDSNYRWMGSLAVDGRGNMALGYSVSNSSMFPSIRYAGRLASDPLGALPQGELSLFEGSGSQQFARWGDYSAMTVDPVDDCTFWYTTEYLETTGYDWQTRIGSFSFPSCGQ